FEGVFTMGHPIDALYGGRFRYDLLIRNIDGGTCEKIAESITGADIIEHVTLFTEDLDGEKVRVSSISESSSLTVLENADGDIIFPGGGIIIDEMRAKLNGLDVGDTVTLGGKELEITGIAREILYNVMYVSPDTAADLGYSEPNGLMIKLGDGADIKKAERQISDIDKNAYFTELSLQKKDIKSGFAAMRTVMFMFAVLAFAIGSLLIINLSIIDFNENKIKHATLRAIGTPVGRFAVISLVENLSRVLLGVIVALPVCKICVGVLLGLLSNASQQYVFTEYGKCLAAACAIPFLYVLFGILVSLRKIKKMNFNDCLSEVE
ncbi:MAG: hypothetical protein KBS59_02225, partial [Clostridiales bacterium]|nr:hypothetical protein [Clostridiales bacterium]